MAPSLRLRQWSSFRNQNRQSSLRMEGLDDSLLPALGDSTSLNVEWGGVEWSEGRKRACWPGPLDHCRS
ncbi:hypothetical protein FOCG_04229 [Fusarium oxysporum f. sp. radicis-lycopersici 26381]|nr:hypothetical protein FOCG_04229 [Fusarium oxysporum f. sp. radicis-lycopersici 26381]